MSIQYSLERFKLGQSKNRTWDAKSSSVILTISRLKFVVVVIHVTIKFHAQKRKKQNIGSGVINHDVPIDATTRVKTNKNFAAVTPRTIKFPYCLQCNCFT